MESAFEKLLARLADAGVDFVVVGGVAVAVHGYVRVTEDVDLVIDPSPENVRRLLGCLADYGEGAARELTPADFTDEEGAIRIVEETESCQIDLFTRVGGTRFADLIEDARRLDVGGRQVRVASIPALIRIKSGSVRERDRLDVLALKRLAEDPRALD